MSNNNHKKTDHKIIEQRWAIPMGIHLSERTENSFKDILELDNEINKESSVERLYNLVVDVKESMGITMIIATWNKMSADTQEELPPFQSKIDMKADLASSRATMLLPAARGLMLGIIISGVILALEALL